MKRPFRRIKTLATKATTTAEKLSLLADVAIDVAMGLQDGSIRIEAKGTKLIPPTLTFGLVSEEEDEADE